MEKVPREESLMTQKIESVIQYENEAPITTKEEVLKLLTVPPFPYEPQVEPLPGGGVHVVAYRVEGYPDHITGKIYYRLDTPVFEQLKQEGYFIEHPEHREGSEYYTASPHWKLNWNRVRGDK